MAISAMVISLSLLPVPHDSVEELDHSTSTQLRIYRSGKQWDIRPMCM